MSILQHDIMAQAKGNTKSKASTLAKVSIVAALTLWGGVTNPLNSYIKHSFANDSINNRHFNPALRFARSA